MIIVYIVLLIINKDDSVFLVLGLIFGLIWFTIWLLSIFICDHINGYLCGCLELFWLIICCKNSVCYEISMKNPPSSVITI